LTGRMGPWTTRQPNSIQTTYRLQRQHSGVDASHKDERCISTDGKNHRYRFFFFYRIRRRAAYHYIKIGEKEGPRGQYKTTHTTTPHRKLPATHAPVHMKRLRPKTQPATYLLHPGYTDAACMMRPILFVCFSMCGHVRCW